MSVSREIKIRLLTKHQNLSEFINQFTIDFWSLKGEDGKYSSIPLEDEGEFNYQFFPEIDAVLTIINKRESAGKLNAITFWNQDIEESINCLIYPLINGSDSINKHYEFHFTPGIGKRINGADRYTDFGYYLNQILPKLTLGDCQICEVECKDFDC